MKNRRILKGIVGAAAIAVVAGAISIAPAGAHVSKNPQHLWKKHIKPLAKALFYTKGQSNKRFYNVGETVADATNATSADHANHADNAATASNLNCADCVDSTEIKDEAGQKTAMIEDHQTIPTTAAALTTTTITVPGPGSVVALASGTVVVGAVSGDNYLIRLRLNEGTSTSTDEDGSVTFLRDDNPTSGTKMLPFSTSRTFTVTEEGNFTVNLTGFTQIDQAGAEFLDDHRLHLMYFPTDY